MLVYHEYYINIRTRRTGLPYGTAPARGTRSGGRRGIRTLERFAPLHAFQACQFNHSCILPYLILYQIYTFIILTVVILPAFPV